MYSSTSWSQDLGLELDSEGRVQWTVSYVGNFGNGGACDGLEEVAFEMLVLEAVSAGREMPGHPALVVRREFVLEVVLEEGQRLGTVEP